MSILDGPVNSENNTRIYIGRLPKDAGRRDIEDLFNGYGQIEDMKLMHGFGFLEFHDARDAEEVVKNFNGRSFMGERISVELSRGGRRGFDDYRAPRERPGPRHPRPRRSQFRVLCSDMGPDATWQDLKDLMRTADVDVSYTEISKDRDGTGIAEFETEDDLRTVMKRIKGSNFRGQPIHLEAEISTPKERSRSPSYRRPPPFSRRSPDRDYGRRDDDRYPPIAPEARKYGRRDDDRFPPTAPEAREDSRRDAGYRSSPPPREYRDRDYRGSRDDYGRGGRGGRMYRPQEDDDPVVPPPRDVDRAPLSRADDRRPARDDDRRPARDDDRRPARDDDRRLARDDDRRATRDDDRRPPRDDDRRSSRDDDRRLHSRDEIRRPSSTRDDDRRVSSREDDRRGPPRDDRDRGQGRSYGSSFR